MEVTNPKYPLKLVVVAHTCNLSTPEAKREIVDFFELETNLIYIKSSRLARLQK